MSALDNRAQALRSLSDDEFDLVIVGGGVTGAGIARDAVLRGLKVGLIERFDFAYGTSSKSSKLVHGGLRYLEHAQFRLVFEGTNERALLMKVAPHLVKPLEFLVPSYKWDRPGLFVLDVGLWIYDALSKFSSPRLHRTVRAGRVAKIEPGLKRDGLEGGILYYDAQTDDARLTLENIVDAKKHGASIVNYAKAVGLRTEGDKIVGVEFVDRLGDENARIFAKAKVVVNASGPWCDEILQMAGQPSILASSKGVHLVIDHARLPVRHAIVMKENRRVVFTMPSGDRTIIGTTDTYYDKKPEEVCAEAEDVDYLIKLANSYFPEAKLTRQDVLATWAGVRPLVRPDSNVATASDVSREHHILSRPGLVTIAGGKLTTFRRMATEVVDAAAEQIRPLPPTPTDVRPLLGGEGLDGHAGVSKLCDELGGLGIADAQVAKLLGNMYGSRARKVAELVRKDPALGERIDPELGYIYAQVVLAVEEELAMTLDDMLGRRIPLILRARDQGLGVAEKVADRMATLLKWSDARRQEELKTYRAIVDRTRKFR